MSERSNKVHHLNESYDFSTVVVTVCVSIGVLSLLVQKLIYTEAFLPKLLGAVIVLFWSIFVYDGFRANSQSPKRQGNGNFDKASILKAYQLSAKTPGHLPDSPTYAQITTFQEDEPLPKRTPSETAAFHVARDKHDANMIEYINQANKDQGIIEKDSKQTEDVSKSYHPVVEESIVLEYSGTSDDDEEGEV